MPFSDDTESRIVHKIHIRLRESIFCKIRNRLPGRLRTWVSKERPEAPDEKAEGVEPEIHS